MNPIENLNMFELKEVARLYTAEDGYKLVVGKFDHPVDLERTAALAYYHVGDIEGEFYVGETMCELRSNIESGIRYRTDSDRIALLINDLFISRVNEGRVDTTVYKVDRSLDLID